MRNKILTAAEAVAPIGDGASVMVGGFMACGSPEVLIDALVEKGPKNLTVIGNDAGWGGKFERGIGKLIHAGLVKTLIASHVGLNPEVAARMNTDVEADKLECILVPQGTLAERVRVGGYGLGGFLTPTGVGTIVETDQSYASGEPKRVIEFNGKKYLLEEPLRADFALVRGSKVDKFGNVYFHGTTVNFNPLMAMAADHVIVGAVEIVETGTLDPNAIGVSGVLVDSIVGGEQPWPIQ
ncbi:MAG: CoA transferase subunit A [Clostridiales Family XIII bacterium]|jgi:acetate CoA/acetoacetate CoA-transferase alpha subunit|nr:CoA transferase subunit A [Clostridiales Family XIII bacterium]